MRGLRSFLALVVIAAGLGAYLYFVEPKQTAGDEKKLDKVFAALQADKIDQITVKSESGDRTTVQKQSGHWQVTQPVSGVKADEGELSGITTNLASLEVQRVIDEQGAKLGQYSLDKPRIAVSFRADGAEHTLDIGGKTPTGTDLYAKLGDKPRVFLISSFLDTTFNRTTFDLRDKAVLPVDRDHVDHVTIKTPDHELALAKDGSDWKITSPFQTRADFTAVEGLIGRVNTAQMKAITAPDAAKAAEYGLDKPAALITLGAGSSQATLAIGKTAGDGVVYARDMSRPMVFTVESGLGDDLKKPADEYRVKDLFDARTFNATRLELVHHGQTRTFERVKGEGKDNQPPEVWKQVKPSAKNMDSASVDALVAALTNTRASSFVASVKDTGLDKPEATATITYDDGKKHERVSFGRHGSDAFAAREGDPGAAKIDASAIEAIAKAIEGLK